MAGKQKNTTLVVDVSDLRTITQRIGLNALMDQVIKELEQSIREYSPARFTIPAREGFDYSSPSIGLLEWMPAMHAGEQVAMKVVGYHPQNPSDASLPTVLSTMLTYDTHTGHLQAVMDGTLITALRTGAASAIASRVLARPGSRALGLIGCGAQAVAQLHALSRVFDFEEVLAFDLDRNAMNSFRVRIAPLELDRIRLRLEPPGRVVREADILCTATSVSIGEGPVIDDIGVQDHIHINAVGSDFPGKIELPHDLLERALVYPDFTDQAIREGECQQLRRDQIGPDLSTLIKEDVTHAAAQNRLTVFDSTGWALEDHVTCRILFEHARRLGLGKEMEIESAGADPLNAYEQVMGSTGHLRGRFAVVD